MPQLAVAAAGAYIGGAIGGTLLGVSAATIGWTLGSIAGSLLFAPDGPKASRQETRAAKLQFGAKIPRVRGRMRLPLNPRWVSDWRATSQEADGKGGGGGSEFFTYSADGLFWVCAGIDGATGVRLWHNGKLVWSSLAASDDASLVASADTALFSAITFHDGNAAQLPWPVYEAAVGTADADAHRGLFCVSIENYQAGQSPQWGFLEVEFVEAYTGTVELPGGLLGIGANVGYIPVLPTLTSPIRAGDSIVLYIKRWVSGAAPVFASGWPTATVVSSGIDAGSGVLTVYTRTATGTSADGTMTFTTVGDAGNAPMWGIVVLRGEVDVNWPGGFIGLGGDYNILGLSVSKPAGTHLAIKFASLLAPTFGAELGDPPAGYTFGAMATSTADTAGFPSHPYRWQVALATKAYTGTVEGGGGWADGSGYYESGGNGQMLFAITFRATASGITPLTVDLEDVTDGEMAHCLNAAQYDNTALAGIPVTGWVFNNSARQGCEELAAAYYFGATCRDKLFTRLRGAASVVTIPFADSGAGVDKTGEPFTGPERNNDQEIPAQWTVTSPDLKADYEAGTESSPRVATTSVEVRQITLQGVFTPPERKGRAQAYAQDARVSGHPFAIGLADQYAQLEPFDVITATDEEGNTHRLRITAENYAQGVHAFQGVRDDQGALPTSAATSETYEPTTTVASAGTAEFLALDLPLLREAFDDPGYIGAVKNSDTMSVRWFESPDNVTQTGVATYHTDAIFGTVTAVEGSFAMGTLFDEGSSITADLGDGVPASVTRAALLASREANAFAVGINGRQVLGQFRTATLLGAGIWKFTGLLNMGGKGTEQYCASIVAGDTFCILGTSGIQHLPRSTSQLGVPFYIKAVPALRAVSSVAAVAFTNSGVCVKPLSPVDLRAARDHSSGDITISAKRRTRYTPRFGGSLGDACPLGETIDVRRWRLYTDGTFTTLLRTLADTTNDASNTYTAAQRATDGHTLTNPIYVKVVQVSATVGEGYPLQDAA